MWVGCVSGTELTRSHCRPAAFCVVSWAGVAASAGLEDGSLASQNGRGWCVKDEAEARNGSGCHSWTWLVVDNAMVSGPEESVWMDTGADGDPDSNR